MSFSSFKPWVKLQMHEFYAQCVTLGRSEFVVIWTVWKRTKLRTFNWLSACDLSMISPLTSGCTTTPNHPTVRMMQREAKLNIRGQNVDHWLVRGKGWPTPCLQGCTCSSSQTKRRGPLILIFDMSLPIVKDSIFLSQELLDSLCPSWGDRSSLTLKRAWTFLHFDMILDTCF